MKNKPDDPMQDIPELPDSFKDKGVTRRDFMKFCAAMAAALARPSSFLPPIAGAVAKGKKPYLVWLEYQDCAGDSEALLRTTKPTVGSIVLDVLAVEYHETIMAAAGHRAEKSLMDVVNNHKGE